MNETTLLLNDNDEEDKLLISSWMDRKDEQSNKFELYNMICQLLESETDNSLIEAFDCAGKHDRVLFEVMIKHHYLRLVDAVRKKAILSFQ